MIADESEKDKDINLGNMNISNYKLDWYVLLNNVNLFDVRSKLIINKNIQN